MTALSTDLVRQSTPLFGTTLEDDIDDSVDTVTLQSVTGLSLVTAVTIIIDAVDGNNNPTPELREVITGVVNAGAIALETCLRGLDGTTAQSHSSGANVQMWVTSNLWNDFQTAFLNGHVQLGGHQSLSDVNGTAWISQVATSDAVNNLQVANAAATDAVVLSAVGSDTNISLSLVPKGTGIVEGISTLGLSNPYKFSVYKAGAQSIPGATETKVQFDTDFFDTSSDFDKTTNFRFTAPIAGFYAFAGAVSCANYASEAVIVDLYKNGAQYLRGGQFTTASGSGSNNTAVFPYTEVELAEDDYIELWYFHANGSAAGLNVGGPPYQTYFTGELRSET